MSQLVIGKKKEKTIRYRIYPNVGYSIYKSVRTNFIIQRDGEEITYSIVPVSLSLSKCHILGRRQLCHATISSVLLSFCLSAPLYVVSLIYLAAILSFFHTGHPCHSPPSSTLPLYPFFHSPSFPTHLFLECVQENVVWLLCYSSRYIVLWR